MTHGKSSDPETQKALFRYQVISPVLDRELKHGDATQILKVQASKTWRLPSGEEQKYSFDTMRGWLKAYRRQGFAGLYNKARTQAGCQLPEYVVGKACELKKEVPERGIEKIIKIMEEMEFVTAGVVKRTTLHRAMQKLGLSGRTVPEKSEEELIRFVVDHANDLWQSDMLYGPWLPDPNNPKRRRQALLYAYIDDCSRLLLYGRFFFKGNLPALELTFKRAMQRYGIPKRAYYDNGLTYRSNHMQVVCAELGIKASYTRPYRPEGHGKIEAFNRYCRRDFLAELKATSIATLDELNEAFLAWVEREYNEREHSELKMSPKKRWVQDAGRVQYADEAKLRQVFLWREERKPDKCGVFSLFGKEYEVSSHLAGKKVEIRYNPDEPLDVVEVWHNGTLCQRARQRADMPYRFGRPRAAIKSESKDKKAVPKTDYLNHLVHKRRNELTAPLPQPELIENGLEGTEVFIGLLKERLEAEVMDENRAHQFYETYGPLDIDKVQAELEAFLEGNRNDLHIDHYLNFLLTQMDNLRR